MKYVLTLIFCIFITPMTRAAEVKSTSPSNITTDELEQIFQNYQYEDYIYMPNWLYPPIFTQNLPSDFATASEASKRNRLFIMTLTPLALKINAEIEAERSEIIKLDLKLLTPAQEKYLEEKAAKYDIFTNLKGLRRYDYILSELNLKVDMIPVSFLIAVAAIESNWGTSNVALKANNLYKQKLWYTTEGLKPEDDEDDNSYRYEIFPNLYASMNEYVLKLNSHINYEMMRFERAELRYREQRISGRFLAHSMIFDSNLENFAGLLDYTITFYELINLDKARLMPYVINKK